MIGAINKQLAKVARLVGTDFKAVGVRAENVTVSSDHSSVFIRLTTEPKLVHEVLQLTNGVSADVAQDGTLISINVMMSAFRDISNGPVAQVPLSDGKAIDVGLMFDGDPDNTPDISELFSYTSLLYGSEASGQKKTASITDLQTEIDLALEDVQAGRNTERVRLIREAFIQLSVASEVRKVSEQTAETGRYSGDPV